MSIVSKVDSSIESYALYSMSVMGRNGALVSWFTLFVCRLNKEFITREFKPHVYGKWQTSVKLGISQR